MHNNYYFLRQLTISLEKILKGSVISECFSQNKDELMVRFETPEGSFYIKGNVQPDFSCLSFPENFHRARKNSVDLFPNIIGRRVVGTRQFSNERSFALMLSDSFMLLFKMHGNYANIIMLENNNVIGIFRKNIEADTAINIDTLDRHIDWSFEHFTQHQHNLQATYFTFGKVVWRYIESLGFDSKSLPEKWKLIEQVRAQLESPVFYVTKIGHRIHLSLLKWGEIKKTWYEPIAALNDFFYTYIRETGLEKEKSRLHAILKTRLENSESFRKKNTEKLQELRENNNYKTWADLIMANLHAIRPGEELVTVDNFYNNNTPLQIRLRTDASPQKNAERYYRKSKNQQIQIDHLQEALKAKEEEISDIEEKIRLVESASDLKVLKLISADTKAQPKAKKQDTPLPYHEFITSGYRIWVGRNAGSNDVLTFKLGFKDDLWLHAKDVAGSHVLIKYQAGKKFPKEVIERAAQLAAYNSKRKHETLCPVVVTPRKYVRKRKGDPPGAVVVERETVIMVEPKI